MIRINKAAAVVALCCTAIGIALTGCDEASEAGPQPSSRGGATTKPADDAAFTGAKKIDVDGKQVAVSCSGDLEEGRPVVVLMLGAGDELKKMADLQRALSEKDRVCSYDRLGAGDSDQPDGPQTVDDVGKVLTGVIDQVAGDAPVVLAGHSLGGLLAARYAPDHQDRVAGLVLLDATSPTQKADIEAAIPESATGPVAEVRAGGLAVVEGQNPEQLAVPDGDVKSAGDIPVEVIGHGKPYLAALPEYGPALEEAWTEGQRKWLELSSHSTPRVAANSEHYIYEDEPEVAVQAVQRVVAQVVDNLR